MVGNGPAVGTCPGGREFQPLRHWGTVPMSLQTIIPEPKEIQFFHKFQKLENRLIFLLWVRNTLEDFLDKWTSLFIVINLLGGKTTLFYIWCIDSTYTEINLHIWKHHVTQFCICNIDATSLKPNSKERAQNSAYFMSWGNSCKNHFFNVKSDIPIFRLLILVKFFPNWGFLRRTFDTLMLQRHE